MSDIAELLGLEIDEFNKKPKVITTSRKPLLPRGPSLSPGWRSASEDWSSWFEFLIKNQKP
jgi:hypothetical protein